MKKFYEAPQMEDVKFTTEDIAIVLPDDELDSTLSAPNATDDRM